MSWVDGVIVGIAAFSALLSLWRGTLRELLSLMVWGIALIGGFLLMSPIMQRLEPYVDVFSVQIILGFGGGFLLTLIVGGLANIILLQILKPRRPATPDRLLGTLLGFTRGLCAVVVLIFLASFTGLPNDEWWQRSPLLQQLSPVASWLREFVPVELPPPPAVENVATATTAPYAS